MPDLINQPDYLNEDNQQPKFIKFIHDIVMSVHQTTNFAAKFTYTCILHSVESGILIS